MRPEEVTDDLITQYEGLIRSTAWRYVGHCEEDYDDICQLFRVKTWQALLSFDPSKVKNQAARDTAGRTPQDRYVYACIKNRGKDLVKAVKRNWAYMEDLGEHAAPDQFEQRYLLAAEEEVHQVLQDMPLIPSTLSPNEHQIVTLLYLDFDNGEIASFLNWPRQKVQIVVRRIREKMADWEPTSPTVPGDAAPAASRPAPRCAEPAPVAA